MTPKILEGVSNRNLVRKLESRITYTFLPSSEFLVQSFWVTLRKIKILRFTAFDIVRKVNILIFEYRTK